MRPHRLAVRTAASHAVNRGSIPLGVTKQNQGDRARIALSPFFVPHHIPHIFSCFCLMGSLLSCHKKYFCGRGKSRAEEKNELTRQRASIEQSGRDAQEPEPLPPARLRPRFGEVLLTASGMFRLQFIQFRCQRKDLEAVQVEQEFHSGHACKLGCPPG